MASSPANNSQATGGGWWKDSRLLLGGAVTFYALIPAAIGYIGGQEIPFYFQAGWRLGAVVGISIFLIYLYLPYGPKPATGGSEQNTDSLQNTDKKCRVPLFGWEISRGAAVIAVWLLIIIIGNCDYALFALSIKYIGLTFATALFGIWPIFNIIIKIYRKDNNEDDARSTMGIILILGLLILLCGVGFTFLILSTPNILDGSENYAADLAIGVSLAFATVVLVNLKDISLLTGEKA